MSNTIKRLLVFFLGIPIVIGIVFIGIYNHLVLNLVVIAASIAGADEFYNMLSPKYELLPRPVIIILSAILPLIGYLSILTNIDYSVVSWIFIFEIVLLMGIECISEKEFTSAITKLSLSILIITYTGFMASFITKMTAIKENSTLFIILFILVVFMCDSLAWFFGVFFGKTTRGVVAVSPNKSLVGFLGGLVGSILSAILMKYLFPEVFAGGYWRILIVGVICGISTIVGDLIESLFKRSCNVKDSGKLIPGRGGVLDSIDSLLATAPIFYIFIYFLYL